MKVLGFIDMQSQETQETTNRGLIIVLNFPRFELKSFAPNYDEYMGNFGMPGFVIAMVKASSETIYVTDYGNDTYHMKNAEGKYPAHFSEIHISKKKETSYEVLFRGYHVNLELASSVDLRY